MGKAQQRKKLKKLHKPKGGDGGGRSPDRVDPGIAAAARDNVITIIGQGRVPSRAWEIAGSAFFLAEHFTRQVEAGEALPRPIACGAGCAFCCYNQVELTPPEALLLGHYIQENFSQAEIKAVLDAVSRNLARTAGKSKVEIAAQRAELPCPLMREDRCPVYPVRPLVCRAMHALDRGRCEAEFRAGSLAGSAYYPHRHDIAVSVSAGVREGCRAVGLQAGAFYLVSALRDFFSQENPVERWLNGEEVFES